MHNLLAHIKIKDELTAYQAHKVLVHALTNRKNIVVAWSDNAEATHRKVNLSSIQEKTDTKLILHLVKCSCAKTRCANTLDKCKHMRHSQTGRILIQAVHNDKAPVKNQTQNWMQLLHSQRTGSIPFLPYENWSSTRLTVRIQRECVVQPVPRGANAETTVPGPAPTCANNNKCTGNTGSITQVGVKAVFNGASSPCLETLGTLGGIPLVNLVLFIFS